MIKLNEEQLKKWKVLRDQAINNLVSEFNVSSLEDWKQSVIYKGTARLIDERFNTADRKLSAIDNGTDYIVRAVKETKVSDKDTLIKEILSISSIFTEEMLKKLNINDLRALKDKL